MYSDTVKKGKRASDDQGGCGADKVNKNVYTVHSRFPTKSLSFTLLAQYKDSEGTEFLRFRPREEWVRRRKERGFLIRDLTAVYVQRSCHH
jgi:hypothetical protein